MTEQHSNRVAELPTLVRRYVERNFPARCSVPERALFGQAGEMQLEPGRWLRFTAEQEASTRHVEFSWRARFPIAPLVALHVGDWYRAGNGALEVKLFGLPLKRSRGSDVAKGEAMRYLAELPWVPYAFVANRELEWRELDDQTVEVSATVAGARASICLHFDATGDIVGASAQDRPRAVGNRSLPTPFAGEFGDYKAFNGVRVPTTAEVRWELDDGPFIYFRGRVTSFAAM